MPAVDLLCLANSNKEGGRCVAGLRADTGQWVRAVSPSERGQLYPYHYTLPDGTEPRVLDLLRIGVEGPRPLLHQPENWLIDGTPWQLMARPAPAGVMAKLAGAISKTDLLFGNPSDRIAMADLERHPPASSLALVEPYDIHWFVWQYENRKKLRVQFRLGPYRYDLGLTDPVYVDLLKDLSVGPHNDAELGLPKGGRLLLTASLGEPFNGFCYKLVAALVQLIDRESR